MRAYIMAAAVIALTQPALAAKAYHKKSHHHHVSHHAHHHHYAARGHHRYAARGHRMRASLGGASGAYVMRTYARRNAAEDYGDNPFFPNGWGEAWQPWQQGWGAEPVRRSRHARAHSGALDEMIARHAAENGLPVELVHRVVTRESGYNPRARNGSNLGLMQIKYATARGVGYTGPASGLMDPETNLTYATRYLAGAYRAAGGNANRAVALYASGYYKRGVPRETRTAAMRWGE